MTDYPAWERRVSAAYDKWREYSDWSYADFLEQLPANDVDAVVLRNFNYQVCNGGFEQWVANGYASDSLQLVRMALRRVGGGFADLALKLIGEMADMVDTNARSRGFGPGYWLDDEEHACRICRDLDRRYYRFNKELMADVEAYFAGLTGEPK